MRTRWRLLALPAVALLLGGCAAIPAESQPEAIPRERTTQPSEAVPQPTKGLDPLTMVRDFVHANAQPSGDYAASKAYLAPNARKSWQPDSSVTIVEDEFSTVYAPEGQGSNDSDEQTVIVRGNNVGRLDGDGAFIASGDSIGVQVRLRMQSDGEWRIVDAPSSVLITEGDFAQNYSKDPVYFFATDSQTIVPDIRYVLARPQSGRASRVMDLLLSGPSKGLDGALRSPLGDTAGLDSNVTLAADGALVVPLSGVDGKSDQDKKLIAAQIVRSLQNVTTSRIRILSDGTALVDGHPDWLPSELPTYEALTAPRSELPGLMTIDSRIRSLGSGAPIDGPAGAGNYDVVSAAQSITGGQLAVVERMPKGERDREKQVRLRVGDYGTDDAVVDLTGRSLTRPSWRPPTSLDSESGELWTVVNGDQVVRVLHTSEGQWAPQSVNASDIVGIGAISALRLSRDGSRVAAIAGGKLVVASVVRSNDSSSVTLSEPRVLQQNALTGVVDVDWLNQSTLVAATELGSAPVVSVSVDGQRLDNYNSANLTPPVRAIAAAPGRPVVAADSGGLWTVNEVGDVWRLHPQTSVGALPFYPG